MVGLVQDTARTLMEHCLTDITHGLMAQDFDRFRSWIGLPYDIHCFEGHARYTDAARLRAMFDRACAFYVRHGVTDLIRVIRDISQPEPGQLRCLYETREITGRDTLQGEPFFCLTQLVQEQDGRWLVRRSEYDLFPTDAKHQVLIDPEASVSVKNRAS